MSCFEDTGNPEASESKRALACSVTCSFLSALNVLHPRGGHFSDVWRPLRVTTSSWSQFRRAGGIRGITPQDRRSRACWDGFLGPGIKLGGGRLAGGCGRVAGGGGCIGAEDRGTAALDIGRRTGGGGGGGVIAIEVGDLAKGKGCGRRPGSGVID